MKYPQMKYPTDINKDNSGFVSLIAASMLLMLAVLFSGGVALAKQEAATNAGPQPTLAATAVSDTIVVTATRLR
ncbi:MAG: hypothetical protein LW838_09155 [Nitrosomonadaceae bacterium]|jgi:hypothetical protein|nr:hypothetical protein [Nitrosomonadaceae bacterium]